MIAYDQLEYEAWSRLEHAADDPSHPMRLVFLATLSESNAPDGRLMVLRGSDRQLGRVWFYADSRSQKVTQLRANQSMCIVCYDPREGVQLRVQAQVVLHQFNELADRHWAQANALVRSLFSTPDRPGSPLCRPDPRLMSIQLAIRDVDEGYARSNFTVIDARVEIIEWLQVNGVEQRRALMHATTGWAVQPLAP